MKSNTNNNDPVNGFECFVIYMNNALFLTVNDFSAVVNYVRKQTLHPKNELLVKAYADLWRNLSYLERMQYQTAAEMISSLTLNANEMEV